MAFLKMYDVRCETDKERGSDGLRLTHKAGSTAYPENEAKNRKSKLTK